LALRLFVGTGLIALIDSAMVPAAIKSHYLSHENLAYGPAAIAVMRAELSRPPQSVLWKAVNWGLGGALVLWAARAVMICLWPLSVKGSAPMTARGIVACLASLAALIFGVWFWFLGSEDRRPPRVSGNRPHSRSRQSRGRDALVDEKSHAALLARRETGRPTCGCVLP
jgi:hypothetical protein